MENKKTLGSTALRIRVTEVCTASFIFLFVYAAVSKLTEYEKFTVQIGQSPMLTSYSGFLAWFIPAIELIIVLLLLLPTTRLAGLYCFFTMMVAFTGYIILASRFSDYVPCSCGGVIASLNWSQHLVFNIVFVLGSLAAILLSPVTFNSKNINSGLPLKN